MYYKQQIPVITVRLSHLDVDLSDSQNNLVKFMKSVAADAWAS